MLPAATDPSDEGVRKGPASMILRLGELFRRMPTTSVRHLAPSPVQPVSDL
jgi:hypothetical protein